jgi:hypothetical protein
MSQIENRLKKLEERITPTSNQIGTIFISFIPALDGKVHPDYLETGPQTAISGQKEFRRLPSESETAFKERVGKSVQEPGKVVRVYFE